MLIRSPACYDGAIHVWATSSNFVRPNMSIEGGHGKGTDTASVVFSLDGRTLLTRGGDDTVKSTFLTLFKIMCSFPIKLGTFGLSKGRCIP